MIRLLPPAFLVFAISAAHAQQLDTLTARRVAVEGTVPDSISIATLPTMLSCGVAGITVITQWVPPPFTSIQPVLSRVAGVQVTPYSGAPGAWATVRIRGVANVSGNAQPLYVVDGVPVYNTDVAPERWPASLAPPSPGSPTPVSDTPTANPLLDLPAENVAQIEVLKGAAATARYGMQGTSGVIFISTREGANSHGMLQPLRVQYQGWGGVQQVRQRYELLNARQYADLANEAAAIARRNPVYSAADLNNLGEADRQDQVFRVAGVQSHHLSVDGLAHRTRYYVAASYLNQAGVVVQSGLTRYQLRTNLEQQLTDKLRLTLKASASQIDQTHGGTTSDANLVLAEALLAAPAVRPNQLATPLRRLDFYSRTPRTRRLLVQLGATYRFSPGLSLEVRASREQTASRALGYSPDVLPTGSATASIETSTATTGMHSRVLAADLRYQHTFADQHAVSASLSYQRLQFERVWDLSQYTSGGTSQSRYSETARPLHSPSVALGYTYDNRYEAQASLRYDAIGYEKDVKPLEPYRYYSPGGQLSWHLHKEAFLADAASLTELTLWAGVGQTGTNLASGQFFSSATPDRTVQHDAGLRLGVLNGHLTLDVTAYQRRTRRAQTVLPLYVPPIIGPSRLVEYPNVKLLNQGVEVSLGSVWRLGKLAGSGSLAFATNRNEVEDLGLDYSGYPAEYAGLEPGQPLGRIYVFEQAGTYPLGSPQAGQIRYRDRNNNGVVDYEDGGYQGGGLPRYSLNFCQQLRLGRVQLDAQLDGLFGYTMLNTTLALLDAPTGRTNSTPRALDRWTPTHQDTNVPVAGTSAFQLTDQTLASGNHVRLSQLTLSYEVLNTATRKLSVWAGGQNLFVTGSYRGFDPNVAGGGAAPFRSGQDASVYPVARVWQLGVRAELK
ncbi:TonB-dependent receptor plug domain-containing protein [Hymenobacter sp. BT523]|uniref:TonB-dependent receptor plug domain-containing protein n=1 Tax=Hymenobacter sp. BT523 TaxID=2795725 RepID=UPI0018EBD754|nr:TonB-dependent receptor plug domain-containing protein [Hymenobacter sp. BT523]MBJ6108921.1 TonB-dependent receptor plug domain-containing protein [Hymenobacter sp. BT523]